MNHTSSHAGLSPAAGAKPLPPETKPPRRRPASAIASIGLVRWLLALLTSVPLPAADDAPPVPFGPVPSERQLRWHELEFYGFLHFGPNTFTDREWGFGDESPALFNPTAFDAGQIARTARDAGMRGLILVAKHHDGFCLWPTATTPHSVKASPWRGGGGDVVRELAEACREAGLRFGAYLSPWDRNHPEYGWPGYVQVFREQLRELLTGYGELFTVWFDGANAGEGYYGVGREMRVVDGRTYYQWPEVWALVRQHQPLAAIFSDAGPDVRWAGNEAGRGSDPCWQTLDLTGRFPGGPGAARNGRGERSGGRWVPPECNVSIRPGWFYHPAEDGRVKSAAQLADLYFQTVGRGASLNLNVPPDRSGQIADRDVESLRGLGRFLRGTFATNLAAAASISVSQTRGAAATYASANLVDGRRKTLWTTDDGVTNATVTLEFKQPTAFDVVRLREYLPLGQRVEAFAVDVWTEGQWREWTNGFTIGPQRLLRGPEQIVTRLRVRVMRSAAGPALSEIGVFKQAVWSRATD